MAPYVPRQRKRRVLDRQRAQKRQNLLDRENGEGENNVGEDSNAVEILPQEERERIERKNGMKEAIREEIRREGGGVSGKKRKRLDKYIVGSCFFSPHTVLSYFKKMISIKSAYA